MGAKAAVEEKAFSWYRSKDLLQGFRGELIVFGAWFFGGGVFQMMENLHKWEFNC